MFTDSGTICTGVFVFCCQRKLRVYVNHDILYGMKIGVFQKYESLSIPVRASLWFVVCNFIQKGISVITVPIFTRLLTTAEYGELTVYNSWFTILSFIILLGMIYGMHMQGLVKFEDKKESFTSALQGLALVLVIVWAAIYFLFRDFFNMLLKMNTIRMSAMLISIWTGTVFGFWANTQRTQYKYRALLVVTMLSSFLKPVVEVVMVLNFEDKVSAKVMGTALTELAIYVWLFLIQLKKGGVFFSAATWKYALVFCVPLVPHYLAQTLLNHADRIMIRSMQGEDEAGIYGLAYSISLVLSILVTALNQSVTPWMYEKIKKKKEKEMAGTIYLLMIFLAAVSLFLILLAPEAVRIFAPEEYGEGIRCIPPVTIGVFFTFCYSIYGKFAIYYEKKGWFATATVVSALLNIVLNYLAIPVFGYVAAGYTTMICYILYSLFHYIYMKEICRRECGGRYPYNTWILILIQGTVAVLGMVFSFTYDHAVLRYAIAGMILLFMFIKRQTIVHMTEDMRKAGKESM